MLSFSPFLAILPRFSHPWSTYHTTRLIRLFSPSLSFPFGDVPPKVPPGFIPLPETMLPRPPCCTCSSRGCILFLGERRSLSAPFRSLLASDTSTLSPPSLSLSSPLSLSLSPPPGEYVATAPEAVARILSTRCTLRHATPRHATLHATINREKERE